MSRTVERLLAALEPLPHARRLEHLARSAQALALSGELPSVLVELDGLGAYERRLAALAALVGRQTDFLAGRLGDRDHVVSGYALRATRTLPIPDAAIEAAYTDASSVTRCRLARAVTAGRRTALAERLVVRLREEWGDAEAARLLTACSAEFVARLLPELAHAVESWTRLARLHPDPVLDHAERDLAGQPRHLREAWWQQHAQAVAAVTPVRPERVLTLLERHGPGTLPWPLRDRLGALVAADAERTVRWLMSPDREEQRHEPVPSPSVLRRLVRADPPSLPVLGRHWFRRTGHFAALLKAMPPSRRNAFFDAATAGIELETHLPDLDLLPRERRWAEVRRWVSRSRTEEWFWGDVLDVLAHGPVAEARPELLAALRRPDAGDRALVWPLLVANAGRSGGRAAVQELLVLMQRLRNEQDPVRAGALEALADVRPDLFTAESAGLLDRIVVDALEARDSSYRTRDAVRRLAVALLREHAVEGEPALLEWALRALERIVVHTGVADLGPLHRTLRRGQEHQVFEALRPWLEAAGHKADHRLLFALTAALGTRAHRMPALQEMLEEALVSGDDAAFATAARLWLDAPSTRGERVARILALEPSAAVLPPVQHVLTAGRTDLLDILLGETPPYGRFLKRGTRRPLPAFTNADRWLPRQQAAAGGLAAAAAADESRPFYDRAAAIRSAAPLPVHGRALALRYADSPDVVLAEAALAALAWTERPEDALPTLLAHAGGDRARVAVYAATRAARFATPTELVGQLGELLITTRGVKVTSRKEAVRLAARHLPPRRAAALLAAAYRAPGGHPDVQAAVVAFSTELLSEEEVWAVLTEAPHGDPQVLQALVRAEPWALPAAHRPRYARLVGEVCRATDTEVAEAGLRALPRWAGYAPESAGALPRIVTDLGRRAGWRAAAQAVGELAASGLPHPLGGAAPGSLFHETLAGLLAAVGAGEYEALADRDLPARQRVAALLGALPPRPGDESRPVLEAAAAQLADEPSLAAGRIDLLRRLVELDAELPDLTERLRALAEAARERPVLAAATASRLPWNAGGRAPRDPATLLAAAEELAAAGEPAAGLLAAGLVETLGCRLGWPDQWRAALRSLRRHPAADVRDMALAVTVQRE
ncbi:hypothetical protein [Streptomyces sp. NPDC059909]|uniref:hypothetical protein n=1 Tax=Streptomyces sp. NPDC059909 TaxID=3346998 RepID=UPI00364E8C3B